MISSSPQPKIQSRFASNPRTKSFVWTLLCVAIVVGLGCKAGDDDDGDDSSSSSSTSSSSSSGGTADFTVTGTADSSGVSVFDFTVPAGTTKLGLTGTSSTNAELRYDEIIDDGGRDYLNPNGESISFADGFQSFVSHASVPSRGVDPSLRTNGFSATLRARAIGSGEALSGARSAVRVISKVDGDLNNGRLNVNVFFVGEVAARSASQQAVNAALEEFTRIYQSGAGISVNIRRSSIDGPNVVPDPFSGDALYLNAANSAPSPAVNLIVAGDIGGLGAGVLGIAGSIPGAPVPTARSGVAISLVNSADQDGVFSQSDILILAETIAHEIAHFLGLFHPIELSGSSVRGVDPLGDTATCDSRSDCLANASLIGNFMFPAPVIGTNGQPVRQNLITGDQRGVMNRYIAVD